MRFNYLNAATPQEIVDSNITKLLKLTNTYDEELLDVDDPNEYAALATCHLFNMLAYDMYGRLRRASAYDCVCLEELIIALVANGILANTDTELLLVSNVHGAIEFLNDLWYDNECNGHHNKDGSMKR